MTQRLPGVLCVVLAFAMLSACGGGGSTTGPSPTPTSITVTSTGTSLVPGQTETFTATLTLSNGTTQPLTGGTWGSDAAAVASVNSTTGLVTALSKGDVTIFVDAQGLRGSKRISITSSYTGTWTGLYTFTSCTQTGAFLAANLCAFLPIGAQDLITFTLAQTGTTINGTVALDTLVSAPFTTTMTANGALTFTAVYTESTLRISQAYQVSIAATGQLAGTLVQTWTDSTVTGQMVVGGTLLSVVKSSADHAPDQRRNVATKSLADAVAAFRRR